MKKLFRTVAFFISWLSLLYSESKKTKWLMNNETLYFEGDGVAFGEAGKVYKWFIPFPMENWSFEEVSWEEYERAVGAGLTCVPFDPASGPENTENKVLRTYPPDHVRNCCCSLTTVPADTSCNTNWVNEVKTVYVPVNELKGAVLSNFPSRSPICPIKL